MNDLHAAIMNLPCKTPSDGWGAMQSAGYKEGHRDARHAAAELSLGYVPLSDDGKTVFIDGFGEVPLAYPVAGGAPTQAPSTIERWIIARETLVQGITTRPKLAYTVLADAEPFDGFDAASAWIKKHDLPLGWVAMQADQSPWNRLFPTGATPPARTQSTT